MTQRCPWLSAVLAVATTAIGVFLVPALELLRLNSEYFVGLRDGTYLYVAGGVVLLVGSVAWVLRRNPVARFVFWLIALAGPGWLLYAALGVVAGPQPVFVVVAVATVGASVLITISASEELRSRVVGRLGWLGLAFLLYLGFNIVLTATAFGDDLDSAPSQELVASAGTQLPNIYHLVLDEFQTDVFEAIRDDEVDRVLRGFTFFPEAVTEFGRTEMAMATVFGLEAYRYDRPLRTYMRDAFSGPGSLVTALEEAGYATHAYLHSQSLTGGDETPFDWYVLHADQAPTYISSDKRRLAVSVWAFAHLPPMISEGAIPASHQVQLEGESLLPEDAPPISAASFRALTEDETTRPSSGQYVLGHFILPHFPSVMTDRCDYESGVLTGVISQSRCALNLVEEFLEQLEALGRFDDSLILIHGDHGGRYVRRHGTVESVGPLGIFSEEMSHARSRPLLLAKPPGVARPGASPLASVAHPALLSDIAATVLAAVGQGSQAETAGSSVLVQDFPERPIRYYHMYDKEPGTVISGPLHRYRVGGDEAEFDAKIDVPAP